MEEFFSEGAQINQCTKSPVFDNQQRNVETRYKVSVGKNSYTLNMYHTTSTCLVNGKETKTFLQHHLSSIINVIEERLLENGVSLEQINGFMRDILNKTDQSNEKILTLDVDDEIQFNYSEPNAIDSPCQTHTEHFVENNDSKQYSQLFKIVLSLQTSFQDLEKTVENHIHSMHDSFAQLRDEISSVKNQIKTNNQHTGKHLDDIEYETKSLKSSTDKICELYSRKMQSISDALKTLNENTPRRSAAVSQPPSRVFSSTSGHSVDVCCSNERNAQSTSLIEARSVTQLAKRNGSQLNNVDKPPSENERENRVSTTDDTLRKTPYGSVNSDSCENRHKILIIGDSILKHVDPNGLLSTVDVLSISGAKVSEVSHRLHATDLSFYKHVILYVGGNDVSAGKPLVRLMDELIKLTSYLTNQGCSVHISTVAPRKDVSVLPLNNEIEGLSRQFSIGEVEYMDLHKSFVYGDGLVVEQYYYRDEIHLNRKGTSLLVRRINEYVPIVKTQLPGARSGNKQNRRFQPASAYPHRSGVDPNMRRLDGYKNVDANGATWPDRNIRQYAKYQNNMQHLGNRQSAYPSPTHASYTGSSMNTGNRRQIYNDHQEQASAYQYTGGDFYQGRPLRSHPQRPRIERNYSVKCPDNNKNFEGRNYTHGNRPSEYRVFCEICNMNNHSTDECVRRY